MRVVVLADTHLRRDWPGRRLPDPVLARLDTAEVVLHAGDVLEVPHLAELETYAPVYAVLGNNDRELVDRLPESVTLELDGVRVAMLHDSGPTRGREQRLHRRFPEAHLVVFGHSHAPVNAPGIDGQWLFNPGSPTERRRQPHPTFGVLELNRGHIDRAEIIEVDRPL